MLTQLIIFGAAGDLTRRKLIPALLASLQDGLLPKLQVVGVSRRDQSDADFRASLKDALPAADRTAFEALAGHIYYRAADAADPENIAAFKNELDALARADGHDPEHTARLFYLALGPRLFGPTTAALSDAGLLPRTDPEDPVFRRVVVEKPFGTDLASAQRLNAALHERVDEHQIFRIDHYLGKETVQNILLLRFQNAIFEPLWSRRHIESVEITVSESVGMEGGRAGYYDKAGALRDMVQNHLLQLLALVAMEPPNSLSADDVRDEKVKVLKALVPYDATGVAKNVVRGQYQRMDGSGGYLTEDGVPDGSHTETYVALRAQLANWRWNGVPFLLRTGKRLAHRYSEILLRFRTPPVDLLGGPRPEGTCGLRPNTLRILVQPTEGIRLDFLVKQPGAGAVMRPSTLGFNYADLSGGGTQPAYQRLILDALEGNATLFIRGDEAEAAWRFIDTIHAGWAHPDALPPVPYLAGSMGPPAADGLWRDCEGMWSHGKDHTASRA